MSMWQRLERHELRRRGPRRRTEPPEPAARPDPSRPPGTDLLPQVMHIVLLMMENHSYDNYLGMLPGRGEGIPLGPDGQPELANLGVDGQVIRPFHLPSTVQHEDVPSQSWHASHHQWGGGNCDGFVASCQAVLAKAAPEKSGLAGAPEAVAMGYWSEEDLPFYYGLARTFPVADHWFASCLGPTFPNRRFLVAGTAHGLIDDSTCDLLDYPPAGTIFDLLTRHGISWANYHPVAGQSRLAGYARHKRKMARRRLLALTRPARTADGLAKDLKFTGDVFPLGLGRYLEHVRSTDEFLAAAAAGSLPAFSLVDPDFDEYSEENPQDIRKGESFAAEMISQVMRGPGWPHTLLIWLYDEHGGYHDHVPPPPAVPPDEVLGRSRLADPGPVRGLVGLLRPGAVGGAEDLAAGPRRYDRYGFRVPAVIVSPYARPGYVCSTVLDHTSVLRLVEDKWNLPALTARDAAASSPLDAVDLTAPPAFLEPPGLPRPSLAWGSW